MWLFTNIDAETYIGEIFNGSSENSVVELEDGVRCKTKDSLLSRLHEKGVLKKMIKKNVSQKNDYKESRNGRMFFLLFQKIKGRHRSSNTDPIFLSKLYCITPDEKQLFKSVANEVVEKEYLQSENDKGGGASFKRKRQRLHIWRQCYFRLLQRPVK